MPEQGQRREVRSELCDTYDGRGRPLGIVKMLSEIHRDGDWHRSFHCWIVNPSWRGGAVLLQIRGKWKRAWPGRVDTSAAGHYEAGEEGIEGGLRELAEELGVRAKASDLIEVGTRICVSEFTGDTLNHEFQDVRFLVDERPLQEYQVSLPEVGGPVFLRVSDGLSLLSGECASVEADGFELTEEGGEQRRTYKTFQLAADDFIPTLDRFYLKAFILADRILKKEKHLQI